MQEGDNDDAKEKTNTAVKFRVKVTVHSAGIQQHMTVKNVVHKLRTLSHSHIICHAHMYDV